MIKLTVRRSVSDGFKSFFNNLERYKNLSYADKNKLLSQFDLKVHISLLIMEVGPEVISEINKKLDLPDNTHVSDKKSDVGEFDHLTFIKRELKRLKSSPLKKKQLLRKEIVIKGPNKFYFGIDPTKELDPIEIKSPLFSTEKESESLVSDVKKATRYELVQQILEDSRPVPQHALTDDFLDVLSRAIEENLSNLERPTLVNELSDYRPAYALKRAAFRNLLLNKCVRNAFEDSRVEKFIDSQIEVYKQRLNAPLPPEVLEPLLAFRGDVYYSFSPMKRLQQKLNGINIIVDSISKGLFEMVFMSLGEDVLSKLPEFAKKTDYPFNNYYGFKSSVPNEVTGSIRMGKENREDDLRYPNLQCVAHSLPKDPKYRAIVSHSIKVLERSKGWDQTSKIKAINRLINVYNSMSSSDYYSRVMEKSVPTDDSKPKVIKTLTRQEVFNKGLRYIQSLFRNHWNRSKRK
ncbi:uncharacterized protein TA17075 [Theileria annulata]|uniref:Uncharacterized protein n=1 Tax=Theileria annulata TaxID=5874 RepID=Q4UIQ3_THEAN|nr:uncharacterized protein TA17075 [Theileria annulata]CAI73036.1 hypothetical protein, conserved [Theileria annulata]|eukprot:XP_953714.1 hypothetical protein, conserved [Theileria annulata]